MILNDFKQKYQGEKIDQDGAFGAQCMDLIKQYCVEVLNIPVLTGNAVDVWTKYPADKFLKVNYIPGGDSPQHGDIVIWGTGVGQFGHIAICDIGQPSGFPNGFISFDQNWPVGSPCALVSHNFNNVLGWLRPVTAAAQPTMVKLKVAYADEKPNPDIEAALEFINQRLQALSGGKLGLELTAFYPFKHDETNKGNWTTDEALPVLKSLHLNVAPAIDWLVVCYTGNMVRPWTYTVIYEDFLKIPFTAMPKPFNPLNEGLEFECGHALIELYNERRGALPSISNEDNLSGGEQYVADKVKLVLPYLYLYDLEVKPSVFKHSFITDMVFGQTSEEIRALQQALKLDGTFPASVAPTGYYGPTTAKAVYDFGIKYSIAPRAELVRLGGRRAGPAARKKLNELYNK